MKEVKSDLSMPCNINGVLHTPLKVIDVPGGDVLHGIKINDIGYKNFGEAYFTTIEPGAIKAWKRHRQMTLNLIVPIGEVRFVMYDSRQYSESNGKYCEIEINRVKNYSRLTVPPMVWVGFKGLGKNISLILNIADIQHDPQESDNLDMDNIAYNWGCN